MTRVFIADASPDERFALRAMMCDLHFEVIGEAADWASAQAQVPASQAELLVVDIDLLPNAPIVALDELRKLCPAAVTVALISKFDARQQLMRLTGADTFISKVETADRVIDRFLEMAASIRSARVGAEARSPV